MSVAIGIDLGTTNTVVAAVIDGVAVTLEDEHSRRLIPSVVSFQPNGTVLVGEPAREKRLVDPENTIYSVKPLFGRAWDSEEAQAARQRFPFKLVQGTKGSTAVEARGTTYALPEISAFVLRRAKQVAESRLNQPVDKAVITVPANFNDLQRASTKIAGKLAGLDVMRILNEPTAAALAYGQSIKQAEKIAIYDLGGGTFDVTLLDLTNSVFEVLATAGDTALGGDDIDRIIVDKILKEVQAKLRVDSRGNAPALARIGFLAEEIKKHLSGSERFDAELTGVAYKSSGRAPLSLPFAMTRTELEQLARPLLDRTVRVAQQSIASVGLSVTDFERVILVGGATRMPLVPRVVEGLFGKAPHLKVNPDEVVALGAAIQAHALNRAKGAHKAKPPPVPRPGAKPNVVRPASKPGMNVVRPASKPGMPAVRPSQPGMPAAAPEQTLVMQAAKPDKTLVLQAPRPGAKAEEHPAASEMMSFSKGPAMISWELPGEKKASPPPPPPTPRPVATPERTVAMQAPTPARPPIDELDVPDLDIAPPAARSHLAGPTDIVAAPSDLAEFGLDLPMDSSPYPVAPEPPSSQQLMAAPEEFGELDLAAALTPERFQQGSAIATSAATPLLIDVTPLSLGVETAGGYADVLIPSNSPVPCEKTRTFLTANDGQTSVTVRVAQGESPKFALNTRLGDVELSGLRAAYRGEVKISVTFELDADGILNVRARDPDTGRETVATMRLVGAASEAEDIVSMAQRQAQYTVQ